MSEQTKAVNFTELLDRMEKDRRPAEGWPTIAGAECAEDELLVWLAALDLAEMDVRIWEFTDHCTIGPDGPPDTAKWLERARLFGEGGDLDVRRDGDRFLWRFVGKEEYAPDGEPLELPTGDEIDPVYRRERTALLWGERKEGQSQWFDDRTAGAVLTYPVEGAPARVQVRYYEYTQAGRTLAVWLRGLEAYDG
jgi:hypothetical protein